MRIRTNYDILKVPGTCSKTAVFIQKPAKTGHKPWVVMRCFATRLRVKRKKRACTCQNKMISFVKTARFNMFQELESLFFKKCLAYLSCSSDAY